MHHYIPYKWCDSWYLKYTLINTFSYFTKCFLNIAQNKIISFFLTSVFTSNIPKPLTFLLNVLCWQKEFHPKISSENTFTPISHNPAHMPIRYMYLHINASITFSGHRPKGIEHSQNKSKNIYIWTIITESNTYFKSCSTDIQQGGQKV